MNKGKILGEAITFDDVLLVPARSDFVPSQVHPGTLIKAANDYPARAASKTQNPKNQ